MTEAFCENCKSEKAVVILSRRERESRVDLRLCRACAREKEILSFGGSSPIASDICRAMVEEVLSAQGIDIRAACLSCGTMLAEIVTGGYLGCPSCYSRFSGDIERIALRHHGAVIHRGKSPFHPHCASE